jgi:hypothetical protein
MKFGLHSVHGVENIGRFTGVPARQRLGMTASSGRNQLAPSTPFRPASCAMITQRLLLGIAVITSFPPQRSSLGWQRR